MREKFYGYINRDQDKFKQIWDSAIFIYDTNVLLNLYRYSENTQKVFIDILQQLKTRSWIPFLVAEEFFKNRLEVIKEQENLYEKIQKIINFEKTKTELQNYKDRHFSIDINEILSIIDEASNKINTKLEESKKKDIKYIDTDVVLDKLLEIFHKNIGEPLTDQELEEKYKKGKKRYDLKIPPGYMDAKDKPGNEKYNDYIIWSEVISYAQNMKKNIIFVTDDRKEDWWQDYKGRTLGPRLELIHEFYKETGLDCLIYRPHNFIEYASQSFNVGSENISNVVDEISKVNTARETQLQLSYLSKSALDVLDEDYGIGIEEIKQAIGIMNQRFTTIDLVRNLDGGTYIVGLPINKALGRVLSELKESLNIEPLSRTNEFDDNRTPTTTQTWSKVL